MASLLAVNYADFLHSCLLPLQDYMTLLEDDSHSCTINYHVIIPELIRQPRTREPLQAVLWVLTLISRSPKEFKLSLGCEYAYPTMDFVQRSFCWRTTTSNICSGVNYVVDLCKRLRFHPRRWQVAHKRRVPFIPELFRTPVHKRSRASGNVSQTCRT